jgi:hypothetical protein
LYFLVLTLVSASLFVLTGCPSPVGGNAGDDVPPVLSWHIMTVDNAIGYTSIALDSADRPHISYFGGTDVGLKYVRWTGSSWDGLDATPGPDMIDSVGNVGMYTSIAIDSNDRPSISYYDYTNGHLKFVRWTGSAWDGLDTTPGPDSIDAEWKNVGKYSCMALDSNDYPHISYYDSTNDGTSPNNGPLKYVHWTGTAWDGLDGTDGPDSLGRGQYTSIAVDSNDRPHISYFDPDVAVKYLRWTGSSWAGLENASEADEVDTTTYGYWYTSIALDSNNNPHISYGSANLRYARWTGTKWAGLANASSVDSVDTEGSVGDYTSIAVDASDRPHISYHDATNHDLKYIRWTGSTWDGLDDTPGPDSVDTAGDVGTFTSIALDAAGFPHISYCDTTNHDLKYAYFGE